MKSLILASIVFFAVQSVAVACPNLSGKYVSAKGEILTVKHEGNLLQINNEEPAIIDGTQHEINFDGGMRIVYTGTCPSDTQVVVKITAHAPNAPHDIEVTQTMTVTAQGFHMSMTGDQTEEEEYTRQ